MKNQKLRQNKVIVIDAGVICHRSIFSWSAEKKRRLEQGNDEDPLPSTYTYLNTCYSILKKIGITRDDLIIVAKDGRNSWRRAFLEAYKAQRHAGRQSHELIDWDMHYGMINKLENTLNESTNWHFIQLNKVFNYADLALTDEGQRLKIEDYGNLPYDTEFGIESDDIQSVCPKYFPDHEVVLVTIDEDLSQNYYYKNCKIFSPNLQSPTNKAKKGFYTIVPDPLKILSKKVASGDKSDNILVDKNDSERDIEVRQFVIDLLNLPDFIEKPIIHALNELDLNKKTQYDKLPFQNSLAKKFDTIYDQKGVRTFAESMLRYLTKEIRVIEKRSKKTPEQLYEKNENYKKLKDQYDELNIKKKTKVKA